MKSLFYSYRVQISISFLNNICYRTVVYLIVTKSRLFTNMNKTFYQYRVVMVVTISKQEKLNYINTGCST